MNKKVFNCTQGGAYINGCEHALLKDVIDKHYTKKIDKSIIKPLLSYADDGDKLIKKVVPLLKQDIDNLNEIILQSTRGLAANRGLKTLLKRKNYKNILTKKKEKNLKKILTEVQKENKDTMTMANDFYIRIIKGLKKSKLKTVMKLNQTNLLASYKANLASNLNPLVNVAIYGASRKIQGRELNVDGGPINFLKNHKDALIRMERNNLILSTAKDAAKSLKKSYKKTYKLLKKYDKIKDNNLLSNNEIEKIDLSDSEIYFEAGNWAHPLLDAKKILDKILKFNEGSFTYNQAKKVYDKAIDMKESAIKKAKDNEDKNSDHERKLLKYNELLEKAKKIGREDQKYEEALKLIKQAAKFLPEETEARWGLATAYHHSGKIDESLKEYKKLVKDFPDNHMFAFEYGQVLLTNGKIKEGLKQISSVMEKTEEYDNFIARIGEIYEHLEMKKEAISAYNSYLKKFSYDFKIWTKRGDCLFSLDKKEKAIYSYKKALKIKPDYKIAQDKLFLAYN